MAGAGRGKCLKNLLDTAQTPGEKLDGCQGFVGQEEYCKACSHHYGFHKPLDVPSTPTEVHQSLPQVLLEALGPLMQQNQRILEQISVIASQSKALDQVTIFTIGQTDLEELEEILNVRPELADPQSYISGEHSLPGIQTALKEISKRYKKVKFEWQEKGEVKHMSEFSAAFQQVVKLPKWVTTRDVTGNRSLLNVLFFGVKKYVGTTHFGLILNIPGLGPLTPHLARILLGVVDICKPCRFNSKFRSLPAQLLLAREETVFDPIALATDWSSALVAKCKKGKDFDQIEIIPCTVPEDFAIVSCHVAQQMDAALLRKSQGEVAMFAAYPQLRRPSRRRVPVQLVDGYPELQLGAPIEQALETATTRKREESRALLEEPGVDDVRSNLSSAFSTIDLSSDQAEELLVEQRRRNPPRACKDGIKPDPPSNHSPDDDGEKKDLAKPQPYRPPQLRARPANTSNHGAVGTKQGTSGFGANRMLAQIVEGQRTKLMTPARARVRQWLLEEKENL